MNEGVEALLEQIKKLQQTVDENHAMLVSVQRRARLSIIFSSLKWIIILGITFGAFYYIQPYLERVFGAYTTLGNFNSFSNATSSDENMMNAIRAYMPR